PRVATRGGRAAQADRQAKNLSLGGWAPAPRVSRLRPPNAFADSNLTAGGHLAFLRGRRLKQSRLAVLGHKARRLICQRILGLANNPLIERSRGYDRR